MNWFKNDVFNIINKIILLFKFNKYLFVILTIFQKNENRKIKIGKE